MSQKSLVNSGSNSSRAFLSTLLLLAAFGVSNAARAAVVTEIERIPVVIDVEVPVTVKVPVATGTAVVIPPSGIPQPPSVMPAGGGTIKQEIPGQAFAGASVDNATQKTWHAWGFLVESGSRAFSNADIHKVETTKNETRKVITYREIERIFFDASKERRDGFFGPRARGTITINFSLNEEVAGTTTSLFDSITTLSDTSPDVVHDSTGLLTWRRAPGFFDGFQGDLGGLPNEFSNNKWLLDSFSLSFENLVTLNPDESRTVSLSWQEGSSGTALGGSGVIGVSDIPEPPTYLESIRIWGVLATGGAISDKLAG